MTLAQQLQPPRHRAETPTLAEPDALIPLAGGWNARRVSDHGRTRVEVRDTGGGLVGLVSSTRLPIASVDGAWRGFDYAADGTRQWWALAVGHARPGAHVSLTFSRLILNKRLHRLIVTAEVSANLWIASVSGQFTTVTFHQGADEEVWRLRPTQNFWRRPARR